MAQHGKPQLHTEINQAMEWREVHAGHNQKGVCEGAHPSGWAKAADRFLFASPTLPIQQLTCSWILCMDGPLLLLQFLILLLLVTAFERWVICSPWLYVALIVSILI